MVRQLFGSKSIALTSQSGNHGLLGVKPGHTSRQIFKHLMWGHHGIGHVLCGAVIVKFLFYDSLN